MKMIKEQVLILKVRYDDAQDQTPHTWDWSGVVGNGQEIEVMNHGAAEPSPAKSTT
jgi:hypothetical protein